MASNAKEKIIDPEKVPICQDLLKLIRQSEDKEDETSLQIIVEKMKVFYKKMKKRYFFRVYSDTLIVCFTYENNVKALNVTRLLGMFAVSLIRTNPECEKFTLLLMNLLYELSMNRYVYIKIKTCQFAGYFVKKSKPPINLPESFRNKIRTIMLEKLTMERNLELRKEAANVACRLQNPEDPECPAVKWFCTLISGDPSNDIKKYLLSLLAVPNVHMDILVTATKDIDDDVRTAAYKVFQKVQIWEVKSIDRTNIIFNGLCDCENVRQEVKKVLQKWLLSLEKNHVQLIRCFDIQFKSSERIDILLNAIFEISDANNLLKELSALLNADRVIPAEKLSFFNVLIWKHSLVYYADSIRKVAKYFKIPDYDKLVAKGMNVKLVPDMKILCGLIREYYLNDDQRFKPSPPGERAHQIHFWFHFLRDLVLNNLLRLFDLYDFFDEVGRKELYELLFDLLAFGKLHKMTVPLITNLYLSMSGGIDDGITRIMNVINKLCIKSDPLEEATENNSVEKRMLFNQREPNTEDVEEIIKKVPEDLLVSCMILVFEMMQSKEITKIGPKLNILFEQFVLTVLKVHGNNNKIMPRCSVVLSSFCLRDKELALKYTKLFVSRITESEDPNQLFQYSRCVFDMFVKYDLAELLPHPESKTPSGSANMEMNCDMHPALVFLLSLCDKSEYIGVVDECILGLCKMLLAHKTKSPTVLSKILLFQIDPSRRDYPHLQESAIPLFLDHFVKNADYAIEIIAEAFIMVLKEIVDKNEEDSIFEFNAEQFVNKMPILINKVILDCEEKSKLDEVEYKLVNDICEEILRTKSTVARQRLFHVMDTIKMNDISASKLSVINERLRFLSERLRKNDDSVYYGDIISQLANKVAALRGITLRPEDASDDAVEEEEVEEEEEEFVGFEEEGEKEDQEEEEFVGFEEEGEKEDQEEEEFVGFEEEGEKEDQEEEEFVGFEEEGEKEEHEEEEFYA